MKKIETIERAITEKKSPKEAGINSTFFWAYRDSIEAGSETINFAEVIWDYDIEAIIKSLRENNITEFTISSTFSRLIETIAEFEKAGCKLMGLTTVTTRFIDFETGEKAKKPAFKMVLC